MKNFKTVVSRSLKFAPLGVTVGLLLAINFSFASHSSQFYPSTERFVSQFTDPLQATLVSMIIWALMGAIWGGSSVCFDQERWSITRQTATHFLISYGLTIPLALLAGWTPLELKIILDFTITYCSIYLVIWIISITRARIMIKQINQKISK